MVQVRQITVKNILSKSGLPGADFSANPYNGCLHACRYCYAAAMTRFRNNPEPWGEFLDAKEWKPLIRPERYEGKRIFLSSVTDPYQSAESEFMRTRALLEQLQGSGCELSILTKSDLALRDIELIRSFKNATIAWSINTLDEDFRKRMDNAPEIARRIRAMRIFHEAGIRTACFIAPVFPEITEVVEIIEAVKGFCNAVWIDKLNLRGAFKNGIFRFLGAYYPHLIQLYRNIFIKGDYGWWENMDEELCLYAKRNSLSYITNGSRLHNTLSDGPEIVNYAIAQRC